MSLNANIIAGASCLALLTWLVLYHKSGARGVLLTLAGCLAIIAATFASQGVWRLVDLAGIMLAALVLLLLVFSLSLVIHARRRRPRYQAPDSMIGTCSKCGGRAALERSRKGWLCSDCAGRAVA